MLTSVKLNKVDGRTGGVRPSVFGILAIIACAEKGPQNVAAAYARPDLVQTDFGAGMLADAADYHMNQTDLQAVCIRATGSTAATYGTVTNAGAGTSVLTAGATAPYDDYDVLITFVTGGTVGVAGITYTYSLDNGTTKSATIALGVANSIVIPGTNVTIALAAGTILAGQTCSVRTTGPRMTNADLVLALEALRVYGGAWEGVLVMADLDPTMVATLDAWILARENEGKFRIGFGNARMRNAGETPAAYQTAMTTAWAAAATIRVCVGADGGDKVCNLAGIASLRGIRQRRYTALGVAVRSMAIDMSVEPAYVDLGPIPGFTIVDAKNNPKFHNEALNPGLDDLRLTTFRTHDGYGSLPYVNNSLILSPPGSDYVYVPHVRVMNAACEVAFRKLTAQLSKGVRRDPTSVYILESEAQFFEELVQEELESQFATTGRVSGIAFVISRTDDLTVLPAKITAELRIASLSYVKTFEVNAGFVKTLAA